jgi:hypothetical protein
MTEGLDVDAAGADRPRDANCGQMLPPPFTMAKRISPGPSRSAVFSGRQSAKSSSTRSREAKNPNVSLC